MRISDWSSDVCSSDLYAGREFAGVISAIDPQVDPDTRNVSVQATLKNPKHELLPGMFADVVIDTAAPQRHLTVPHTAIAFNPYDERFDQPREGKGCVRTCRSRWSQVH